MKKIALIITTIIIITIVGIAGVYYIFQPRKPGLLYFGHGPIADVQELMSEIPTLREYAEKDPETLRDLGFNPVELKESLKTKESLLQQSIQKLLESGEDIGQLLGTAYIYKHHDIINLLLESGVDINTPYQSGGATMLHMAAFKGDIEMLNFLIEHGADVNATDSAGIPVIQAAVIGGPETVALLIKNGADVTKNDSTLLHFAVLMNKEDIVRIFLKHRASVRTTDQLGRTPLFYTTYAFIEDQGLIYENRGAIAELLIAHKADVMARDNYNETPLHAAALWGADTVASILIKHGADIEAQDNREFTPLFMAALGSGTTKNITFNFLKSHHAKMDHNTKNGITLLHVATRPDIAKTMLEHGIQINVQDNEGNTPLHYAYGCSQNMYSVSYLGVIPYNLFRNDEIIIFLKESGADVNVINKKGKKSQQCAQNTSGASNT